MISSALVPIADTVSALGPVQPHTGLLPAFLDPQNILEWLGPWAVVGVCLIVFIETGLLVGFFLPGDSLLFTAGLFTASGHLLLSPGNPIPVWMLGLFVFISAFAGDQLGFYIGHKAGPAVFKRPNSRLFRHEYVDKAHSFFERYGGRSVILARFVPVVRTFTPVIAGVAKMPYRTFITFNLIGAFLWGVGVTMLGFWLGQIAWVGENIDLIFILIVALSVIPIAVELLKARRTGKISGAEKFSRAWNDDGN